MCDLIVFLFFLALTTIENIVAFHCGDELCWSAVEKTVASPILKS